jgi:hypothetical protein
MQSSDGQTQERRGRAVEAEWADDEGSAHVDVASEDEEEVDEQWDDQVHRVTKDGLYIGSMDAANNLIALQAKGITHVLMVLSRLGVNFSSGRRGFNCTSRASG